jgi:hypothetical protein
MIVLGAMQNTVQADSRTTALFFSQRLTIYSKTHVQ